MWNSAKCLCENGKYLASIIDNSVICDKIMETSKGILTKTVPTKSTPTKFNEKKVICKMKTFYILLVFLLITTTLLMVFS